MKIGSYNLKIIEYRNGFRAVCNFAGICLWSSEYYPTKQEALDRGIRILRKEFQDGLNDLKPKYQTKSKPVDAVQWFGELIKGIYWNSGWCYQNQLIKQGDWIVDSKVITNKQFEKDYEVIQ